MESFFVLSLLFGGVLIYYYNKIIPLRESCNKARANLIAAEQRKLDTFYKLSTLLNSGNDFEKSLLVEITQLRSNSNLSVDEKLMTANSLLAVAESNPEIKSISLFNEYQIAVSDTENRIEVSRQELNQAVETYNSFIRIFPINIAASVLRFQPEEYFKS